MSDERFGVFAVDGVDRDPDACAQRNVLIVDGDRLRDGFENALRDSPGVGGMTNSREHQGELVSADPRDFGTQLLSFEMPDAIAAANLFAYATGHDLQDLVSGRVAQGVIDVLESIDVDHHDRNQALVDASVREGVHQAGVELAAVGQTCEAIEVREISDLVDRAGVIGGVLQDARHDLVAVAVFGDFAGVADVADISVLQMQSVIRRIAFARIQRFIDDGCDLFSITGVYQAREEVGIRALSFGVEAQDRIEFVRPVRLVGLDVVGEAADSCHALGGCEGSPVGFEFVHRSARADEVFHSVGKQRPVNRLEDEIRRPGFEPLVNRIAITSTGHEQDGQGPVVRCRAKFPAHLDAVRVRQVDVE